MIGWFEKKSVPSGPDFSEIELGIAGVLASLLGGGSFPSLIHALIGRFGWRAS